MNHEHRPAGAGGAARQKASVARRATNALLLILAISGGATVISLVELERIRSHAVDVMDRVLPRAQNQHRKAVDAARLFAAYHKLLHGNEHLDGAAEHGEGQRHSDGRQAILRELVASAAALQATVDPQMAPALDEVVMLAIRVLELGREQAALAERLHAQVRRGEELTAQMVAVVTELIHTLGVALEERLARMDSGLINAPSPRGFVAEHDQLSAQIQVLSVARGAANQLIDILHRAFRELLVAEHLESPAILRRAKQDFAIQMTEFEPLLATLEASPGGTAAARELAILRDAYAALGTLFDGRARLLELEREKGRASQTVDENLDTVASSLNRAAGEVSVRGIERIVDRSALTMGIVTAGITLTALVFLAMVMLGRRHVILPLTQASAALDALHGGDIDVSLPPMRYRELESIRESLARFQISTLELAEMNRRLELEVAERRRSEAAALQARRETLDAIESMADGFALFDAGERLVLSNTRFRQMYVPIADQLEPGLTMQEFLRLATKRNVYQLADSGAGAWPEERLAEFRALQGSKALQMRGGRWIRIAEFRTQDGGTVCIHSDISEARRAEEALLRRTALVQMLREIALDTNEAADIETAIQSCLDKVCTFSGFVIGHAYLPSAGRDFRELVSADIWYVSDPQRYAKFRALTEQTPLTPGVGLPGRVWSSGEPLWIDDVRAERDLRRGELATRLGIGTACAFPVLEKDRVVAVLEFFADRVMGVDAPLQNAIANLTTQLGRITERKRSYMALSKLRHAVEQSPAMILITDTDGVIEYVNPEFTVITGYRPVEIIGRKPSLLKSGETCDEVYAELWRTIKDDRDWRGEFVNRKQDGSTYWAATSISPIRDEAGRTTHFLGIAEDITDRKASEQQIEHLAHYDVLTDLPNRALFQAQSRQILAAARRAGDQVAMLMLDLDDFKDVNDSLGHATGDRLLQQIALRLQSCMREGDIVARLGGDEFALILPSIDSPDGVASMVRRLIETLQQACHIDEVDLYVNASVGVAIFPNDGADADELLKHADLAMYRAKNRARGTYNFFLAAMDQEVQQRKLLEAEMRTALAEGQFHLVYQPQVNLASRRVTGVEALLRWRHPERGSVSPGEFIPIAEHSGLIVPIGEWVLEAACRQACAWSAAGYADLTMAVNLSPIQFKHHDLLGMVEGVLQRTGIAARQLNLEITESVVMQETETNLDLVHALRRLGIRIALDDFGTGYSSLSYLTSLPVDKIKIDRSFVTGVASDPVCERIVHTIVGLGSALGKCVNVEGVETYAQLRVLRQSAVDEIQGFYFSRPVNAQEVMRLMTEEGVWDAHFRGVLA